MAKLDVTTWSWQKVLGGEAAHGMIVLSPRAVERLQRHTPAWPVPKLFRLTHKGHVTEDLFAGNTINTPSMLCVEDQIDALRWAESIGGLPGLIARSRPASVLADWVLATGWVDFLAEDAATRSTTSVCLKIVDPRFEAGRSPSAGHWSGACAPCLKARRLRTTSPPIAMRRRAFASGAVRPSMPRMSRR
jgi:phosphoserine aminotransferase